MVGELFLRFCFGGVVVASFALLGQAFRPRTFGGLFGAAPSVAIASLAATFGEHGSAYVRDEARTMILGAIAFAAYSAACVALLKKKGRAASLSALAAWSVWLAVACAGFLLLRATSP